MNIGLWFTTHFTLLLMLLTGKGFMNYDNYSCYTRHVEMQLNDVIKVSVGIRHL